MQKDQDEMEMLLPWYESGRLDASEAAQVEARLARDPEFASRLALIREEQDAAIVANEGAGAPGPGALDRLMATIDAEEGGVVATADDRQGLFERLFGISLTPALSWAAAAAALLIVVQAATISHLLTSGGQPGVTYETASGETDATAKGAFAFVQFGEAAKASEIADLLSDMDAVIVDGPKPGGVYKVRISQTQLNPAELDRTLKSLLSNQMLIKSAVPAE